MTAGGPAAPAFVLVEPQGPRNVGAVARVMRNFGLSDLRVVGDEAIVRDDEAVAYAMAGKGVLAKARVHATLDAARDGLDVLVAATRRPGRHRAPCLTPWDLAATLHGSPRRHGILLGNEVRGLSRESLKACELLVRIPGVAHHDSLNLAQAAGILAYEVRRPAVARESPVEPAELRAIDDLVAHVGRTLSASGFLAPGDPLRALGKVRRYLLRHPPTDREVGLLHAVLQHWERGR